MQVDDQIEFPQKASVKNEGIWAELNKGSVTYMISMQLCYEGFFWGPLGYLSYAWCENMDSRLGRAEYLKNVETASCLPEYFPIKPCKE